LKGRQLKPLSVIPPFPLARALRLGLVPNAFASLSGSRARSFIVTVSFRTLFRTYVAVPTPDPTYTTPNSSSLMVSIQAHQEAREHKNIEGKRESECECGGDEGHEAIEARRPHVTVVPR
jgi:hypothetical protein